MDIVAKDTHDLGCRCPILSREYRVIERKHGNAYASAIFAENPRRLLEGKDREGAINRE